MDRQGVFRLFDGAIGVKLRVERAESSEPLLEATAEWERGRVHRPPVHLEKPAGFST